VAREAVWLAKPWGTLFLLIILETYPSLIGFLATCEAKFWIIFFIGGRPLLDSLVIYSISPISYCGLIFLRLIPSLAREA
jgi:hypothetical protein